MYDPTLIDPELDRGRQETLGIFLWGALALIIFAAGLVAGLVIGALS